MPLNPLSGRTVQWNVGRDLLCLAQLVISLVSEYDYYLQVKQSLLLNAYHPSRPKFLVHIPTAVGQPMR